jgi:drug/metabolite transporter (DMT)-like permease
MLSLSYGFAAAVAWAVHDLLVRKLTQGSAMLPMLLTVMAAGSVALAVPALVFGGWETMGRAALLPAVAAGVAYMAGVGGLYQALSRAPVRVVAPVLGSFPMLSLGIAAVQGRAVSVVEWLAVAGIVAGIAWVALTGRDGHGALRGSLAAALGWAVLGAAGFAATFALGQAAARAGAEVPVMVVTRITALAGVVGLSLLYRSPLRPAKGTGWMLAGMGLLDATALGLVTASARLPHPEYAAVAAALFGVLTILLAWRVLGERVAPVQYAGIAAVFGGIAVLSLQG